MTMNSFHLFQTSMRLHSWPHFVDGNHSVVLTRKDIIRGANMVIIYMLSINYEDFTMMFFTALERGV